MIEDKNDFLQRAADAFHERVPAALMLWYREAIDLDRNRYRQESKCATVAHLGRELLSMDASFARITFGRLSRSPETAPLCLLLVARYVFLREAFSRRQWLRPKVGGCGDRELNDACLFHLLRPRGKCATSRAFESDEGERAHAAMTSLRAATLESRLTLR
ncbi:MAG: hypothetical protein SV201_04900 [Pseudomonadota bacterium]|nr:hypothetical protein [Pseudomonadota bacterium]